MVYQTARFTVGLTGGIASGKTTVSDIFSHLKVPIVDADEISRALMRQNDYQQITIDHFGDIILDDHGMLDRNKLRVFIFDHPVEKKWLEQLLHPPIQLEIQRQIEEAQSLYVIVVIPLMAELHLHQHYQFNRVCVVDCTPHKQMDRLKQRHITEDEAKKILQQQTNRQQKLDIADDVIENNTSFEYLQNRVKQLHNIYSHLAMLHDEQ